MADGQPIRLGEWRNGSALIVGGSPGIEQWLKLDERTKAKIEKRLEVTCTSDVPVDKSKLRQVRNYPGVFEHKIANPATRVLAFKSTRYMNQHQKGQEE